MTDYQIVISFLEKNPTIEFNEICEVTGLSIDFVMDCEEYYNK